MRYRVDVRGRIPDGTLVPGVVDPRHVRVYTIVTVGLRDDAALHGLLRRIQGMALELVELRRTAAEDVHGPSTGPGGPPPAAHRLEVQFVVAGGLGEFALESLCDVCTPRSVDARLAIDGSAAVGEVLSRLASRGIPVLAVSSQ